MITALDTSVAIPLLVVTHTAHEDVRRWCADRVLPLSGHAVLETYSVLTRLPGDARLSPTDAARLIAARFPPPLTLRTETLDRVAELLADADIVGGAVYDAVVALAAIEHRAVLATRDSRAKATYEAVGARTVVAA